MTYVEQVAKGCNAIPWDLIDTCNVTDLIKLVERRRGRIQRKNYHEKLDGEFTPFTTMSQVDDIELEFWKHGDSSMRSALPSLRNRFAFLHCYSGLLRHESLFLGELSDMLAISHKRERDPDAMFVMVMQIATGK